MAYWYTYPASPTSPESIDEEVSNTISADDLQKRFDMERSFFSQIGNHPQFYAFDEKDYIAWNLSLDNPPYYSYAMCHFADLVDAETLEWIRTGIPSYKHCTVQGIPCGSLHLDKDALIFIFQKASEWVEFKELDKAVNNKEYVNNICWVAAQLIRFQVRYC